LSDSVASVNRLVIIGWVPIGVQYDSSVCSCQVESNTTNLRGEKEDEDTGIVLKFVNNFSSVFDLDISIHSQKLVAFVVEDIFDHI
jgi:hypothetical protein